MAQLPLVSPLDRVLFLRAQPLFQPLEPAILVVLASHARERHFERGDVLIDPDRENRSLLVLGEGTVEVTWDDRIRWQVSAPGGIGALHTLSDSELRHGAVALTSGLAIEIDSETYLQIMEDHFAVVDRFLFVNSIYTARCEDELGWVPGHPTPLPASDEPMPEKLDLVQKLSRARRAELFRSANLQLLTELFRGESERRFEAGEPIQHRGEAPDGFELVVHGSVRVHDGDREGYLGPEELVGFDDLFTDEPRRFDATAHTPVLTLHVHRNLYVDVLEDHFDHTRALLGHLASRNLDRRLRLAGAVDAPALEIWPGAFRT